MDIVLFFIVAAISFVGSIQIGAVNMAVVQTTLNRNLSAGILVAIGGSIPEFIYSFLALRGLFFIQKNQATLDFLNILIIPVFIVIGLFYLFNKESETVSNKSLNGDKKVNFFKGFSLGMLNPQLLPFWFFILVYLDKYFIINDLSAKYAFVLGTGIGALGILLLFAFTANRFDKQIKNFLRRFSMNIIMGAIFIILALIQIIKIYV
jgi:threonine/homoserine/homoserine lactone efflux protein